jgi:hypothetical protein
MQISKAKAETQADYQLKVVCSLDDKQISPAPNGPIWFNITVTNQANTQFTAIMPGHFNYGVTATTKRVDQSAIDACWKPYAFGGIAVRFTLDPSKEKVFHVLLNECFTTIKKGKISGSLLLPLRVSSGPAEPFIKLTLIAPFKVNVGAPLSSTQLKDLSDQIMKTAETSKNNDTCQDAMQSLWSVPDEFAMPVFNQAMNGRTSDAVIYVLGHRPRTPEVQSLLEKIANSKNEILSYLAKQYLPK